MKQNSFLSIITLLSLPLCIVPIYGMGKEPQKPQKKNNLQLQVPDVERKQVVCQAEIEALEEVLVNFFPKVLGNIIAEYAVEGIFFEFREIQAEDVEALSSYHPTPGLKASYDVATLSLIGVTKCNLVSITNCTVYGDMSKVKLSNSSKKLKSPYYDEILAACNAVFIENPRGEPSEKDLIAIGLPISIYTVRDLYGYGVTAESVPLQNYAEPSYGVVGVYLPWPYTPQAFFAAWKNTIDQLREHEKSIKAIYKDDCLKCIQAFPHAVFKAVMSGKAQLGFCLKSYKAKR